MLSTALPPELILHILSYLDPAILSVFWSLNRSWQHFMQENENQIYHAAAFLQGYIPAPDWTLDDCRTKNVYSERTWIGITSWKGLCERRREIENSWVGKGPSSVVQYQKKRSSEHYRRVHRIKVDEKAGYLINTSQVGGIVVTDLETDVILWSLPVWSVRAYAHLEYEQGYIIFDRLDGSKEVWRRTCDIDTDGTEDNLNNPGLRVEGYNQDSRPDSRQVSVGNHVDTHYPSYTGRGHFSPWAVLHMPETSRAYRFVYPNLLVSSKERVYIWDIPTARIVQVIEEVQPVNKTARAEVVYAAHLQNMIQNGHMDEEEADDDDEDQDWVDVEDGEDGEEDDEEDNQNQGGAPAQADETDDEEPMPEFLGAIIYVEISSRHVFLAGRYVLRIFSRETGKCVLNLPSTRTRYGLWRWDRTSTLNSRDEEINCDPYRDAKAEGRELVNVPLHASARPTLITEANKHQTVDSFTAVHVSEDGKHIAALLSGSRLLFLPNFESILASSNVDINKSNRNVEMEQKLYLNTLDIQLLPPRDSRSIYLAFNSGRIVVVTSLSVFVVVPEIPEQPITNMDPSSLTSPPMVVVKRIPYFSNPSWLDACSCLMLSDTGLFLNYNSSPSQTPVSFLDIETETEERFLHDILMRELQLQDIINNYIDERGEFEQYHHLPNGDRIVVPHQFAIEISDKSVIFGIDFAPHCHFPTNHPSSPAGNVSPLLLQL